MISERLWMNRFGRDPGIIGRELMLDGQPYAIVGIAPEAFQILYKADMWTLFAPRRSPEQRRQHYMQVIGRLKPGVTVEQARLDMACSGRSDRQRRARYEAGWGVTIEPLRSAIVGPELRTTSLVLAGVVTFVLLMACANVANLLLARGLGRSREIAVRAALGGSRGRIIQQLLAESVVLARDRRRLRARAGVGLHSDRAGGDSGRDAATGDWVDVRRACRGDRGAAHDRHGAALRFRSGMASGRSAAGGDVERRRAWIDEGRRRVARGARGRRRSRRQCCCCQAPDCSFAR